VNQGTIPGPEHSHAPPNQVHQNVRITDNLECFFEGVIFHGMERDGLPKLRIRWSRGGNFGWVAILAQIGSYNLASCRRIAMGRNPTRTRCIRYALRGSRVSVMKRITSPAIATGVIEGRMQVTDLIPRD
jgi:hypothetical protein